LIQIKPGRARLVPTSQQAVASRHSEGTGQLNCAAAPITAPRVYVIDDDDAVRAALTMLMDVCGYRAVPCADADEFLAVYEPRSNQCVIMDMRMPGLSGAQLQAKLRARGDDVPVIVVTAHHDQSDAIRARCDGALAVLAKPFDHDELLGWISFALAD
jgi:FixJ family two-component response regulator